MSFSAPLFKVVQVSRSLLVNGRTACCPEEQVFKQGVPVCLYVSDKLCTRLDFDDQTVNVDTSGRFTATDTNGHAHALSALVLVPVKSSHLQV